MVSPTVLITFSSLRHNTHNLKAEEFILAHSMWRFQSLVGWLQGRAAWLRSLVEDKLLTAWWWGSRDIKGGAREGEKSFQALPPVTCLFQTDLTS